MGLIKDIYSVGFYEEFEGVLGKLVPGFSGRRFRERIFSEEFGEMEWKQRMRHTAVVLHGFLPEDFGKGMEMIRVIIGELRRQGKVGGLEYIFFAEYIPMYGLDRFKGAVAGLEFVTQFISCEFAVRPFLLKYPDKMIAVMLKWSKHKSPAVRRLASEGSRPRLPWGEAIPFLKKDPSPILPILENLKTDDSDSVRRSVANSLNDIAKDHPEIVLKIAGKWSGKSSFTDAIVKHGSRSLLKKGHAGILNHFGLSSKKILVKDFKIKTASVKTGAKLSFGFLVENQQSSAQKIRIEYAIYYLKANGQLARKVFKISEQLFAGKAARVITRDHSFKLITTRVFYPGRHELGIIMNGEEKVRGSFRLLA